MNRCLLLILLAIVIGQVVGCTDDSDVYALSGLTVIDGRGGDALVDYTIVVRDGVIDSVRPDGTIDLDGIKQIKSQAKYVIPGLWDLHGHTFAEDVVFNLYVEAGVTTIRDMGCALPCAERLIRLRESKQADETEIPRLIVAGPMVDGDSPYSYAFHHHVSLDTIPAEIDRLKDLGVDLIKVRDFLSAEEFYAVADAAHAAGLEIAGHIPTAVRAQNAVQAGMRTVEHEGSLFGGLLLATSADEEALRQEMLQYMQDATSSGDVETLYAKALGADFMERMLQSYDADKAADLVQSFVDSGAAIVPTFVVLDPQLRSPAPVFNGRDRASEPAMQMVPETIRENWQATAESHVLGQEFAPADHAAMADHYAALLALVGQMHQAGVPVLAGTDAYFPDGSPWLWPGYGLHDELEILVNAGLTPAEAIAAASGKAAAHLGIVDVGTIEEGKVADLVLLAANPLTDIHNTTKITNVIINGAFVDRDALAQRRNAALSGGQ